MRSMSERSAREKLELLCSDYLTQKEMKVVSSCRREKKRLATTSKQIHENQAVSEQREASEEK